MKSSLLMMLCSLLFLGCNPSQSNDTTADSKQMETSLNEVIGKDADTFAGKLDELLTPSIAAAITGYNEPEAEKDYNQVLKNATTHSLAYRWKKGRTKKIDIGKNGTDVPQDDLIQISWVKNTNLQQFKESYRNPTAEELKKANEAINNKVSEMKAEGKVSDKNADLGKSMATEMMKGVSFEPVDNVGEFAVWNTKHNDLKVFYKGLEFQINVDISDDVNLNKAKAIAAAQKIITEKL